MSGIVAAARRHPVLTRIAWIATCWAIALVAGDLLVAAGY